MISAKKFIYDGGCGQYRQSHQVPRQGAIQVRESTGNLLKNKYSFQPQGKIYIKAQGQMMTYLLENQLQFKLILVQMIFLEIK